MTQLLAVGAQVGALFFYVFLGFLGRRRKILTAQGDQVISDIIFYFTMPALTVTSMNLKVSGQELTNAFLVLAAAVVLVLGSYALCVLAVSRLRLPLKTNYAFRFTTAFGNVAYLGFPVAYILWGQLGVFYAAMYALGHNVLFWTLGVWLMQDHQEPKGLDWRQILNINVLAIILGLVLALCHFQLPPLISRPLDGLGQATIPLALLLVGSMLAESPIRTLAGNKIVYLIVAIRLIILPLLALGAMFLVPGWDKNVRLLVIMEMAMPAAAIAPAVARKYDGDYNLISEGVVATTLVSLLTIPLWAWLLNYHILT
ncbi:Auxin efflux carrier [Moorella glycerini]|uniref:Membrane transport protein n=1 Tax=Neomoorella stamsii TaxID=1266720 RepID=A0A9X7J2C9_9FIRM|nr:MULTISPECIES: AEC family transporter [Moorella]PRR72181.1 Membrane transport protein [Moorella stamsii]CEP69482.1 Auxin efflux carrier [Moorella glycerini]